MAHLSELRVGIFDSGIGGLTVLHECLCVAPEFTYYYYGDNANAPYGGKSGEEITFLVRRALFQLQSLGVDAVVLACNTATAVCAEEMRREFPFPVLGMEPAVKPAAKRCKNVLVLATPRTAESERLLRLIESQQNCRFTVSAVPDLAGAIEAHFTRGERLTLSDHLPAGSFDGVVLGCTHYVYFRREIAKFYGNIPVFDGEEGTANHLKSLFLEHLGTDNHSKPHTDTAIFPEKKLFFVGSGAQINQKMVNSKHLFTKK